MITFHSCTLLLNTVRHCKYIRRERYAGNLSRSFYIGDVKQEDVKAAFKNGILSISVPKEDKKAKEEKKYITIGE